MVNQNYVLYINNKKVLKALQTNNLNNPSSFDMSFCINEDHLICGLIIQGVPIKGEKLQYFPLKPIEKYLFEFSNIHFLISDNEYTIENTCYQWTLDYQINFWLLPPSQQQLPQYQFEIINFNQNDGVFFRVPVGLNKQAVYRLKQNTAQGDFIAEYLINLENVTYTLSEGFEIYTFPINPPFTGILNITDSVSNNVSNFYSIPQ